MTASIAPIIDVWFRTVESDTTGGYWPAEHDRFQAADAFYRECCARLAAEGYTVREIIDRPTGDAWRAAMATHPDRPMRTVIIRRLTRGGDA